MSWAAERELFDSFAATVLGSFGGPPEMGLFATELASLGRPVFPLRGKAPWIKNAHPNGGRVVEGGMVMQCRGECGQEGHGLWDATTDQAKIDRWWSSWPNANIGIAVPPGVLVIDVDPRSGGIETLKALAEDWGAFKAGTLSTQTGGHSQGRHYYFAWEGPLRKVKRGELPGIDFKRQGGYVVAPPSRHPDTGEPYVWLTDVRQRVAAPPAWLARVLAPIQELPIEERLVEHERRGLEHAARAAVDYNEQREMDSIADWFGEVTYWESILEPHGWNLHAGDGETNGSVWHAPGRSTKRSATVRYGTLFVWSTNTPFEPSQAGDPLGYTKFHAYAVLNHNGDRKAAARELYDKRKAGYRGNR